MFKKKKRRAKEMEKEGKTDVSLLAHLALPPMALFTAF